MILNKTTDDEVSLIAMREDLIFIGYSPFRHSRGRKNKVIDHSELNLHKNTKVNH